MICRNCGCELPEGSLFCTGCGASFQKTQPQHAPNDTAYQKPQPDNAYAEQGYRYAPPPQYPPSQGYYGQNAQPSFETQKTTTGDFIKWMILPLLNFIPVLGTTAYIIFLIVFALDKTKPVRACFYRAQIVFFIIVVVLIAVFCIILVACFGASFAPKWYEFAENSDVWQNALSAALIF